MLHYLHNYDHIITYIYCLFVNNLLDYEDEGRIVRVDFCESDKINDILDVIRDQDASGGGDSPEDLLSAMHTVRSLSWQSDLRFCVVITDAEAHGYDIAGDRFKAGRCPDQSEADGYLDLPGTMQVLSKDMMIDTFYCDVGLSKRTSDMYKGIYDAIGGGFGTCNFQQGAAGSLKETIASGIGFAILSNFGGENQAGLQTFDGVTLSSLSSSLNASLRESLAGMQIDDEFAEADAAASSPSSDDESFSESAASASASASSRAKAVISTRKAPETDFQRLLRELHMEYLDPVRVVLGLSFRNRNSLTDRTVETLHSAGLTVGMLIEKGYPPGLIDVFAKTVAKKFKTI